jgi:hypothetical protein
MPVGARRLIGVALFAAALLPLAGCQGEPGFAGISISGFGMPYYGGYGGDDNYGMMPSFQWGGGPFGSWGYGGWGDDD